jgi:hypothetical protein
LSASEIRQPAEPFKIQEQEGTAWLVRPTGGRFFSLGVCCVERGASRTNYNPRNPGYAAWQHYPDSASWAEATLTRLRMWGFTTVGGWSDFHILKQLPATNIAFAPVLSIGATVGAPWWDMWDSNITDRMDAVARDQILALRDDPRVMGYFSDNEMGWWNAALWKMTLEQGPASGQRQRLIRLLRDTYQDEWSKLLQDFTPEKATDWASLLQGGMLYVKPGSGGFKVMRQFLGLMAERYYQLVHDIIRKYDRRALVLGDRYQSFYYPEVAHASANWVDAASSNLNASWNDGSYLRFYLDTLHQLAGKPILASEFYSAARENGSGNRNLHGGFPVVRTQVERAATLRNTLLRLAHTPYVIGADWFQYFDEPPHGRGDGEDDNFGLVDVYDHPYAAITEAFTSFDATARKAEPVGPAPDASTGVPPAPPDPFADFVHMRALKCWDRERGFVKCASPEPVADLYMCWSPTAIYLGLYALDITEEAYYRDRFVPECDRGLWVVQMPRREPLRIRLGAGRKPILNDSAARIRHLSGVNLTVRSITAIALPAASMGRKKFQAADTIQLSSTFLTHGGCYRMDWNGVYTLAN